MNKQIYSVYILKCSDGSLYTGSTNDINKRIKDHNQSKQGAHYTKIRRPVVLVHAEAFRTLKKARAREAEIKRCSREDKIKLINQI